MTLLGVGTTADATNPFSAKLNNALFTAKTVAEGGDGDLRYKLSKEAAANTLSFLFQDNYSGRAEIGLTGDDDFHFKVSPDGSTWHDGIVIDRTTGRGTFPDTTIGGAGDDIDLTLAELTLGVGGRTVTLPNSLARPAIVSPTVSIRLLMSILEARPISIPEWPGCSSRSPAPISVPP